MTVKGNLANGENNWLHMQASKVKFTMSREDAVADIYDKFSDEEAGTSSEILVKGKGQLNLYVGSEIGNTDLSVKETKIRLRDKDKNGRIYKPISQLETYTYKNLGLESSELSATEKPVEIVVKDRIILDDTRISLGVFVGPEATESNAYSKMSAGSSIKLNRDTKINIKTNIRRYDEVLEMVVMEGSEIEVEGNIEDKLEFDKKQGTCKLRLEKNYDGSGRDRIIAEIKGQGLTTDLGKEVVGLTSNAKEVADSFKSKFRNEEKNSAGVLNVNGAAFYAKEKFVDINKLITILDTMAMNGEQLKVKEILERNNELL
jgi:uncharacterized lipoprotein NlpE involved in copper resistance